MIRRPPRSPLLPYPTLFRARPAIAPANRLLDGDSVLDARARRDPVDHAARKRDLLVDPACEAFVAQAREPDDGAARQRSVRRHRSEEHTSELQSRQYLVCRL